MNKVKILNQSIYKLVIIFNNVKNKYNEKLQTKYK